MSFDMWTKKTMVKGLMVECPFGTPLPECPAIKIRKLPFTDRIEIVEHLSEDGLDELLGYHDTCAEKREHM